MAKALEKYKKEFAILDSKARDLLESRVNALTNIEKLSDLILEAAKEIGRRVQVLRDGGAPGTTLKDFKSDKDVASILKYIASIQKNAEVAVKTYNDVPAPVIAIIKSLDTIETELSQEITNRKKKKDRVIFAIDSKSLPDLEKLHDQVSKSLRDLVDEEPELKDVISFQRRILALTDRRIDEEIALTKASRKVRDQEETDDRAKDIRILQRKLAECKKLYEAIKTDCADAKASDGGDTARAVARALDNHKALKAIVDSYNRQMASYNDLQLERIKLSKDGLKFLAAVEQLRKGLEAADALVKTVSSKVRV
ncbi:hypothetical protein [Azospirillum sp. B510]|uniref:hypothetical protein n=1 Tax=Azospirillum sp. (strain B510) TaxID=137722 RepID=UPI00031F7619|nr:hypothetical protein [Azospirillum sp. B510]